MSLAVCFLLVYPLFGIITPYLSVLLRDLGYSKLYVGIFLSLFEIAGIIGPFIFGVLADRSRSYKKILLIDCLLILISAFPLAYFHHPFLSALFIVLVAWGFRSGIPILDAITTFRIENGGSYGKYRALGSLSFVLVVLFLQWTPFLKPDSAPRIGTWLFLFALLALAAAWFCLGDDKKRKAPGSGVFSTAKKERGKSLHYNPIFPLGLVMIALGRLSYAPVYFLSLYILEELHSDLVGFAFALAAIVEIPIIFISKKLVARFGTLPLLAAAAAACGLRLVTYICFPSVAGLMAGQLFNLFCTGFFQPASIAFASNYVAPENRALGVSLTLALGSGLPTLIGNLLCGFLIEHWGFRVMFGVYVLFAAMSVLMYFFIQSRVRKAEKSEF